MWGSFRRERHAERETHTHRERVCVCVCVSVSVCFIACEDERADRRISGHESVLNEEAEEEEEEEEKKVDLGVVPLLRVPVLCCRYSVGQLCHQVGFAGSKLPKT